MNKLIAVILLAAILIILAILFLPLKVYVSYEKGKLSVSAGMLFFRIKLLKNNKSTQKKVTVDSEEAVTKKTVGLTEKLNSFLEIFPKAARLTKRLITIKPLEIKIITGTTDAALTAISCGALWAVIYNFVGVLACIVNVEDLSLDVSPDYAQSLFQAEGKCIIKSRIAYIIFIAATVLLKLKSRKGKEE